MSDEESDIKRIIECANFYSENIDNVKNKHWLITSLTFHISNDLNLDKMLVSNTLEERFFNRRA